MLFKLHLNKISNFSIIVHITAENQGLQLVTRANQEIELKAQGWNAIKGE